MVRFYTGAPDGYGPLRVLDNPLTRCGLSGFAPCHGRSGGGCAIHDGRERRGLKAHRAALSLRLGRALHA